MPFAQQGSSELFIYQNKLALGCILEMYTEIKHKAVPLRFPKISKIFTAKLLDEQFHKLEFWSGC